MGQYPWGRVLLFEVLRVAVFYPTRRRRYRIVILAGMIYVVPQIYLAPRETGSLAVSYTVGVWIPFYFGITTYLLCAEGPFPDHWRRVRDEADAAEAKSDALPSNFPWTKKFWWMLDIAYNNRMIGWVQEPRDHLPPRPPPSRLTFLWKTSLKFAINTFLLPDLLTSVLGETPAFDPRMHDPTDGPETYLAAVPFLRRVPYVLAYGLWTHVWNSAGHNLVALVCVGLGQSSPTLWPDIWGSWKDAYTVRNFWGCVFWATFRFSS